MEAKNQNRLLWLALLGLGAYHLYSKGYRLGKVTRHNLGEEESEATTGVGGGFVIPILNIGITKKEEPKEQGAIEKIIAKGEENLKAEETLPKTSGTTDEQLKTAVSGLDKEMKVNPLTIPVTVLKTSPDEVTSTTTTATETEPKNIYAKFSDFDGDIIDEQDFMID